MPAASTRSDHVPAGSDPAFSRLWHGFLTARVMVALAVLLLQLLIHALGQDITPWFLGLCLAYFVLAIVARIHAPSAPPLPQPGAHWLPTIGVDLTAIALLQTLQSSAMNYTPLFGIPILLAAVLGSLTLALGTTACVTLLLLAQASWLATQIPGEAATRYLQAGLSGTGYFIVAFLAHQLAQRLAREEETVRRSERATEAQMQVNALVIEALPEGVLVVDAQGEVQAANPAALRLLNDERYPVAPPFVLSGVEAWQPLHALAKATFAAAAPRAADLTLAQPGPGPRWLHARTQLTPAPAQSLCVMFLHDLREMEARLRTEKLAAMGRMSAAVAHEIRNPLAAIVQANALLDEELRDPAQKRLSQMVRQNAERLARIAEEVLDIARAQNQAGLARAAPLPLDEYVAHICRDWQTQAPLIRHPRLTLEALASEVEFDPEHLRRVLVNLLDNAQRYASGQPDSLLVRTGAMPRGAAWLQVWSDGAPLEHTVERHLFEPFFSSESRSSGLGLYICRELCARHGAAISYQRSRHGTARGPVEGNGFTLTFRPPHGQPRPVFDTIVV